jgi:hypothetical protein
LHRPVGIAIAARNALVGTPFCLKKSEKQGCLFTDSSTYVSDHPVYYQCFARLEVVKIMPSKGGGVVYGVHSNGEAVFGRMERGGTCNHCALSRGYFLQTEAALFWGSPASPAVVTMSAIKRRSPSLMSTMLSTLEAMSGQWIKSSWRWWRV